MISATSAPRAPLANAAAAPLHRALDALNGVLLGKAEPVKLALTCLLAQGHLLIEDLPGLGKTTLAHAIATVLGLHSRRVQFTSDLLPADILGAAIYERATESFVFHPGPIFAQLILADEINRATPKTQSALLEAMEERQVTAEGETRPLPTPFFVIATQNPTEQIGAFPLPESQLDRFLLRISLGYPNAVAERALLRGESRRVLLQRLEPVMTAADLHAAQAAVEQIHVTDALLDYLQGLLDFSRHGGLFLHGLSPRAGLGLLRAARAYALLNQRDHVLPEDVQQLLPAVAIHRLQPADAYAEHPIETLVTRLLSAVDVP